jgi:hypothetical protein
MRSSLTAVLALATVVVLDSSVLAQRGRRGGERDGGQYGWVSSLAEGKRLASKTGKPLMVVLRCVP